MTALSHRRELERALAALPENVVGEILHGALVTRARPRILHARACSKLLSALGARFDRSGDDAWILLFEPEIVFGPHILVPSFAGWRRETLPELPDEARMTVAPDFVCEVLSNETERRCRDEKMHVYAANDVGFAWLVGVERRVIEAYASERGRWRAVGTFEGEGDVRIAPFDSQPLGMAPLWAR